jgi:hypothetical protein
MAGSIFPSGIPSAEAFGVPTIVLGMVVVQPPGNEQQDRFWKTPPIRRLICPRCGMQQVDKLMTRCQNCGFPLRGVGAR